uniref:Guanine nucleotide-binding protein alpha-6 subunit n=1 Tax=Wuchereria bancrofti TaxID=6293 RepID=A0AAF5PGG8_WUCBA
MGSVVSNHHQITASATGRVFSTATVTKTVSEKATSKQIDKQLQKEKLENMNIFKVLLLGKILHLNGFTEEDKSRYRQSILRNVVDSVAKMLRACETYRIVHEHVIQEKVNIFMKFYEDVDSDIGDAQIVISHEMAKIIQQIWQSNSIQLVYERRFSYQLLDNAKFFLNSLGRITSPDYSPTTQDILQCRFKTRGIHEINFVYKKVDFKMIDVGGQRSERRKWIHCFDDVNMVLFVVAMSEFDQADPEDESQNRMIQSYRIFKTIAQSDYFKNSSIVLFLNKYDIFQEKIRYSSLKKCWPEYGGDNSVEDCTKYLENQFQRCISNKQKYFAFVTTATDTKNIDLMFSLAVSHIVNQNLKAVGIRE